MLCMLRTMYGQKKKKQPYAYIYIYIYVYIYIYIYIHTGTWKCKKLQRGIDNYLSRQENRPMKQSTMFQDKKIGIDTCVQSDYIWFGC